MKEIFFYFLKLGSLGFGGPLAIVAMMQKDLAKDRQWISEDEFRQTFALIKVMPGPVAFQLAVFLGHRRRGIVGALAAALGLVLPAFLLMVVLASFYQKFVEVPWIHQAMKGMQIGAFALIVWALKSLAQGFSQKWFFWLLMAAGILLSVLTGIPEPVMILLFGLVAVLAQRQWKTIQSVEATLLWVTLKAGAFVFGTGLAIVPFLEADFVSRLGWLTREQFMDALAFGQLTPGPVVITVTFIGYKMAGLSGATLATLGIFFPSFFHMVTWFPKLLGWLKKQIWISAFSLGVTAAVCSAIVIALFNLSREWQTTEWTGLVLLVVLMNYWKVPSWAVVLIGAAGGLLMAI